MLAVVIIPSIMLGRCLSGNGRYELVVQLDAAAKKKERSLERLWPTEVPCC
jgi:hypothetical protein